MRSLLSRIVALIAFSALLGAALAQAAPVALPSFRIDLKETSVSGLSSGAFMAVQISVAYSSIIKGAGIIAGGPYYCAQGDVDIATSKCTCTGFFAFASCDVAPGSTNFERLVAVTGRYAGTGRIDPTDNLASERIWLFSGRLDSVVPPPVMHDLLAYYSHYIPSANIRLRDDVAAEHAMPTQGYGNACSKLGSPYLSNCGVDAAGELLNWIYGDLRPKSTAPAGRMIEFDQSEFLDDRRPTEHGMAETGFAYIPAACDQGQSCRLHVAFHGCEQNVASIGDIFLRHAGYNAWADTNALIILYPQTQASNDNPNACWNWFDFNHDDADYANQRGREMRAVKGMIDRIAGLSSPPPPLSLPRCFTASNAEHVSAGRAHDWFFLARANGSNQFLGFDNTVSITTLKQTAQSHYQIGTCP